MQRLQLTQSVTLNPGAQIVIQHGLRTSSGRALQPNYVFPDRITTIGCTARSAQSVTLENLGVDPQTAEFTIRVDHTIQRGLSDTSETIWKGGPIAGVAAAAAYAEIYVDNGVTGQLTNAVAGVFDVVAAFNTAQGFNGLSVGNTPDKANNQIVIISPGVYAVQFNISFSDAPNTRYHVAVHVNGVKQANVAAERTLGGAGDTGTLASHGLITFIAADVVDLRVACDAGARNFLVGHANLCVSRIN